MTSSFFMVMKLPRRSSCALTSAKRNLTCHGGNPLIDGARDHCLYLLEERPAMRKHVGKDESKDEHCDNFIFSKDSSSFWLNQNTTTHVGDYLTNTARHTKHKDLIQMHQHRESLGLTNQPFSPSLCCQPKKTHQGQFGQDRLERKGQEEQDSVINTKAKHATENVLFFIRKPLSSTYFS